MWQSGTAVDAGIRGIVLVMSPFQLLRLIPCSVRHGAGRGGFSLAGPRPYTGSGGVCFG